MRRVDGFQFQMHLLIKESSSAKFPLNWNLLIWEAVYAEEQNDMYLHKLLSAFFIFLSKSRFHFPICMAVNEERNFWNHISDMNH